MLNKSFVIIVIMLLVRVYTDNNPSNETSTVKYFGQEIVAPLSVVGNKINIWAAKAEVRRRRIKKAFYKFIDEAFGDNEKETSSNTINLSRYNNFNSESKMLTNQLITYHGYRVESHTVETQDGFMLNNFRILPLSDDSKNRTKVVIFLHGLMGSSDDWLMLGSKRSLPYLLLDVGYDVWLINFRGNRYSKFHYTEQINTNEYWDFSFHEMGLYDLSAIIDYINGTISDKLDIHCIGHSMGTTALLVLLSTQSHYNKLLKSSILLAPLACMYKIKGPFKVLAAFAASNGVDSLNFLGKNEFMANKNFPEEVIQKHCRGYKVACYNPLLFLANGGKNIDDVNIFDNVIGHVPAGTSAKTIKHYVQLINSGKFEMFDYGKKGNLRVYGKKYPLSYRLSQVTIPMSLFSSHDDWLATTPDVVNLITQLPNITTHRVIHEKDFSHTDFVWGPEAPEYLFYHIINNLQSMEIDGEQKFIIYTKKLMEKKKSQ